MHNNVMIENGRTPPAARRWRPAALRLGMLVLLALATVSQAQDAGGRTRRREAVPEAEQEPRRLLVRAQELLAVFETERGVRMLESIPAQYPTSRTRYEAWLMLGRHFIDSHEQLKAIHVLGQLRALEAEEGDLAGEERDMLIESLYLTGMAYFQIRQYGAAFPVLRRITTHYPNTVWANQAYYYIGLSHFAQQNWSKAIEALGMVGTFVDPDGPTVGFVEAGRRFYVKVGDADLPVLAALGHKVEVTLTTTGGDSERLECVPLSPGSDVFIGSIPTVIGIPVPGDHTLQVIGGDEIITRYTDANTQAGATNVPREVRTRVVSTAGLGFTLGDFETKAAAAFLDQPLFILLQDVDLDASSAVDSVDVRVISRYAVNADDEDGEALTELDRFLQAGEKRWRTRGEVAVTLTEQGGEPPVHTGRFGGSVRVQSVGGAPAGEGEPAFLLAELDDEIVVFYEDLLHIGGEYTRPVEAKVLSIGQIDNRPRASQDVVFDPVVRAKKHLVEATAYLELARIFRSMGLMAGARERAGEGLERVVQVIGDREAVPVDLRQEAFKLKWELHMAAADYQQAIATCTLFNRIYPDSPFVDEALMGIAGVYREDGNFNDAIRIYRQVLNLQRSTAKAEAQFRIAEAVEKLTRGGSAEAVREYRLCAERYPESHFAGEALSKLVDYHVESRDYAQAGILLEQVFQDYPDAAFLDSMLLKWVLVAFRQNDFQTAYEKSTQLVFEYPESPFAERAKQIMPRIEARLGRTGGGSTGAE